MQGCKPERLNKIEIAIKYKKVKRSDQSQLRNFTRPLTPNEFPMRNVMLKYQRKMYFSEKRLKSELAWVYPSTSLGAVVRPASQNPYPKICDIPYPIYDLTKNSKRYL